MAHGRYTIVGKLADGGMAEIFLARLHGAEGFEKPVILKRILSGFSADPQFRNMFLDEGHISMSLSHGNIVQVLDLGVAGDRTFLVLELVDGWDLERVMLRAQATGPDHPWPPSLALYVTAEVCRALAYAHGKRGRDGRPLGIVHRDVSPSNVLISEQGEVKLADFGIAKAETKRERTVTGIIKGKVGFMSPEQARGHSLDARSDLFSVGTVMYLMLTGRRPFEGGSELESLLRAQRAEFRPPEELNPFLPREATAIVNRAMQGEPAARYQNADEMLRDVEQVLRAQYRSAGQTELKTWLADLARRDGSVPIGRALPAAGAADGGAVPVADDLSAGISVVLSDADLLGQASDGDGAGASGAATPSGPPPLPGDDAGARPSPLRAAASAPPTSVIGGGTRGGRLLRGRRSSRIGVGFFLGALCMLGAVFGIRWLAQWAGREQPTASRWLGLPTAAPPAPAGGDRVTVGPARPTPTPTPAPAPTPTPAVAPTPPAHTEPVAAPTPPAHTEPVAAPTPPAPTPAPAAPAAHATAPDASPVPPGPTEIAGAPPAGADQGTAGAPAAPPPDKSAAPPDSPIAEDEERLMKRVVPDSAAVIGEDDSDEEELRTTGTSRSTGTKPAATSPAGATAARGRGAPERRAGAGASPATRPPPVTLRITSSPVGAVVSTRKHVLGRTPLAIRFNPGNTYELTFVKAGYATTSRRVAVAIGKPRAVSVAMKKSRGRSRFFGR